MSPDTLKFSKLEPLFYSHLYSIEVKCDLEQLREALATRLSGSVLDTFDSAVHLILAVLAVRSPHFIRNILRLELDIFRKRLSLLDWRIIKLHLQRLLLAMRSHKEQLCGKKLLRWEAITYVLSSLEARSEHAFYLEHNSDCNSEEIILPFTFPLRMLAQRLVNVESGHVRIPCCDWRVLLEDLFCHLIDVELEAIADDSDLLNAIFSGEDDRIRQLVMFCHQKFEGHSTTSHLELKFLDQETKYFPPCMANLHQILRRTHRLSHDSRCQYTLFLKDAGLHVDDNIALWESEFSQNHCESSCSHHWSERSTRYVYQIKHMYGLVGVKNAKKSRVCDVFINMASNRMDGGCPFNYLSENELIAALPKPLRHFSDDILKWKEEPRKCCAVYLSKQMPLSGVREIISPIHYYNLARMRYTLIFLEGPVLMSSIQPGRFAQLGRAGPRSYSGSETDVSSSTENLSHEERYVIRHTARQEPQGQEHLPVSNRSSLDVSTCSYNTLIIHPEGDTECKRTSHHFDRSITDIPDDYLKQSQVLKHLAKEVKTVMPGTAEERNKSLRREKMQMSKSQPDLRAVGGSRLRTSRGDSDIVEILRQENTRLRLELESYMQKLSKTEKLEQEFNKVHRAQEELVQSSERRGRLEREARTRLQTDCRRLQEMNRALRDQVEVLSTQLLSSRVPTGDSAVRRELNNRDILITQLIASNKELSACKERQEIELAAQRATLQEQRTHIDILDTALTNAQSNVVRLEEETRKKQMYVELVAQLKHSLMTQQQANDRREQTEQMLRLQLERELRAERVKSSASDNAPVFGSGGSGSCSSNGVGSEVSELKRKLRERDEKIMMLEGENSKWEQRYIEENALRQAAIEAASLPKDAKIAALEKTSQETEKLIAEARSEKMRHMDEQHAAQKRVADLESKVKDLESRLAERDAMIKVLQKHTYDKDSYGFSDLARQDLGPSTSVFSTVSSALTSSTGFTSFSGCSESSGKLYHTPSYHATTSVSDSSAKLGYHGGDSSSKLSFGGDSSSKLSFGGDSYHDVDPGKMGSYGSFRGQSFDAKKSLDDQLKELDSQLDSQLLSKRGLCCFPGFSNPGASSRKGKISQPLLAGVVGLESAGGFLGGLVRAAEPPARPEEMMLLEKQGRSSQRQRAGSLPPSSLPRPRRPRKLGEYGRLSDSEAARKTSTDEETTSSLGRDRKLGEYGRLGDGEAKSKDDTASRPPATPTSFDYGRLKTPPLEPRKLEFNRKPSSGDETPHRPPSTPTRLEFVNFPRLKTPPIDGPFSRKSSKDESLGIPPVAPTLVSYHRLKTPPAIETPTKLDLGRKTPPKGIVKKSFIPPPRKLGEYGRLGGRSASDSSPTSPRDSGEQRASSLTKDSPTPNYRIHF